MYSLKDCGGGGINCNGQTKARHVSNTVDELLRSDVKYDYGSRTTYWQSLGRSNAHIIDTIR